MEYGIGFFGAKGRLNLKSWNCNFYLVQNKTCLKRCPINWNHYIHSYGPNDQNILNLPAGNKEKHKQWHQENLKTPEASTKKSSYSATSLRVTLKSDCSKRSQDGNKNQIGQFLRKVCGGIFVVYLSHWSKSANWSPANPFIDDGTPFKGEGWFCHAIS